MSYLSDKKKAKKANFSDQFTSIKKTDGHTLENFDLEKSSRLFLRDLEIAGGFVQKDQPGIAEGAQVSPEFKIEPETVTAPINANEVDELKVKGYRQLRWAYMDGRQSFTLSNIKQTIGFNMYIKYESFAENNEEHNLFSATGDNGNGAMCATIGKEGSGGIVGGKSFNFPYYSHQGSDTCGIFSVGPIKDGKIWRCGLGGCTLTTPQITEKNSIYTISGKVDGADRTVTFVDNYNPIYFFSDIGRNHGFVGRVSYILIYDWNEKIAELVPAKRELDGVVGFLNLKDNEFYWSKTAPFYSAYDKTNYNSNIERAGCGERDRVVHRITIKSAKRGLPTGYREMIELVTPKMTGATAVNPKDYERYVDFGEDLIPNLTENIIDIDASIDAYLGFQNYITGGELVFGTGSPADARLKSMDGLQDALYMFQYYTITSIGNAQRYIFSFEKNEDEYECNFSQYIRVSGIRETKRTKRTAFAQNHGKGFKIGVAKFRGGAANAGIAIRKITIVSKNTGKKVYEAVPCKKATGEFGLYLIDYDKNKEKFFSFILNNISNVEDFEPFPEESQTYLSGESTLLRDIKETTIYLPEEIAKLGSFYDSLKITNKTGEKGGALELSILKYHITAGSTIADLDGSRMKDYGLEHPEVIADNLDWNETSIENLTAFTATASGDCIGANLTQNQETNRWELAGYGDSVTIVVPKNIETTDGGIAGLADNALSHYRFDRGSGNSNRSWVQLKKLYIPNGYTVLPNGLCYLDNYLEKVIIPSELRRIGVESFHYCYRMKKLLPTNFYGKVPDDIDVVIPNSVTRIEAAAFDGVGLYGSNRMRVCIGESVKYLGYASLSGKFSDIYLPNNIATMVFNGTMGVFGSPNADLSNLNFYCNKDTITYQRLKAHLTSVYNLTEEQADARIIAEDKGGGYINFNIPDTFNIFYAAFNSFYLQSGMVLPIMSDTFQEIPGSQISTDTHNHRSYLGLNFTGPFQVTCQSWYHSWSPQNPNANGRAARIWFTLPKEYDTVEKVKEYFAAHPASFYVPLGNNFNKVPLDMSKVLIGDGERQLFIENEFGTLSDNSATSYGTTLSSFRLGGGAKPSQAQIEYYTNKSK